MMTLIEIECVWAWETAEVEWFWMEAAVSQALLDGERWLRAQTAGLQRQLQREADRSRQEAEEIELARR